MRREFNQKILVSSWTDEAKKKHIESTKKRPKANYLRITKNEGWRMFYQKYRPSDMFIRDFASLCKIHPQTISRWDKGVGSPNFRLLIIFLEYVAMKNETMVSEAFAEMYEYVIKYGSEEH